MKGRRWMSCGSNAGGLLGLGHARDVAVFQPLACGGGDGDGGIADVDGGESAAALVACGGRHSLMSMPVSGSGYALLACGGDGGLEAEPMSLPERLAFTRIAPPLARGGGASRVLQLSCGWGHAALIAADGALHTMGEGATGQLGLGEGILRSSSWRAVGADYAALRWSRVACSRSFTIAVAAASDARTAESVFSWGANRHDALGLPAGSARVVWAPMRVDAMTQLLVPKDAAASGDLSRTGAGDAEAGACMAAAADAAAHAGSSSSGGSESSTTPPSVAPPLPPQLPRGGRSIVDAAVGAAHTALVLSDGAVITFGCNRFGQCGRASDEPALVGRGSGGGERGVADAAAPSTIALPLASAGSGGGMARYSPTLPPGFVPGFGGVPLVNQRSDLDSARRAGCARLAAASLFARSVSCGWNHVAVVGSDLTDASCVGVVITWGRGDMGQLGRPLAAPQTPDGSAPSSAAVSAPSAAASAAGSTAAFSRGSSQPVAVALPPLCTLVAGAPRGVAAVACGSEHTLAIASACGCLWAWGWNEHGNLGLGESEDARSAAAAAQLGGGGGGGSGGSGAGSSWLPRRVPGFGCCAIDETLPPLGHACRIVCGGASSFVEVEAIDALSRA